MSEEKKTKILVIGNPGARGESLAAAIAAMGEEDKFEIVRVEEAPMLPEPVIVGVDFGPDAMSWCLTRRDPDGRIVVIDAGDVERNLRHDIDLPRSFWREAPPARPEPRAERLPAPPRSPTAGDLDRLRRAEEKRARKAAKLRSRP